MAILFKKNLKNEMNVTNVDWSGSFSYGKPFRSGRSSITLKDGEEIWLFITFHVLSTSVNPTSYKLTLED